MDGGRELDKPSRERRSEFDERYSLANERTLLAWNRTALALVAVGLALAHLLPRPSRVTAGAVVLGICLSALGAVVAVRSYGEWRARDKAVRAGAPLPPSRLPLILMVGIALSALAAAVLAGLSGIS